MKDAFIIHESTIASSYGIGKYINELIYSLHSSINLHIVSIYSKGTPCFKIEKVKNITYWHIPVPSVQISRNKEKTREDYYKIVVTLLRLHINNESTILFHINYLHSSLPLAKLLKSCFDCKIITTIHYMEWAFQYNGNIDLAKEIAKRDKTLQKSIKAERELIKLSDKVICLTEYTANMLPQIYDSTFNNIRIIPNGIRDRRNIADRELLRKKHHFSSEEKIILFAGRLDEIKGLHFLLEAFQSLVERHCDYHLLVVGGGEMEKHITQVQEIASKVTFTGSVGQNILFEYMNISNVGVVPSLYEPFGYVALEMMMHSLPVVATSSLNSIMDHDINCKIVPIKYTSNGIAIDTELFAGEIESILLNERESGRLGQAGRKKFDDAFEIAYFKKNMLEIYNSIIF